MSRWMSSYQARNARRAMKERLKEEREKRMDMLVAWTSEQGYRGEQRGALAVRSVRETR